MTDCVACGCFISATGKSIICDSCYEDIGRVIKKNPSWKEEVDVKLKEVSETIDDVMKVIERLEGIVNEIQKNQD
tara:strand:+ start:4968 stop:5192 length:225 start_codon:yes stop_codon:yes gene_type:complete